MSSKLVISDIKENGCLITYIGKMKEGDKHAWSCAKWNEDFPPFLYTFGFEYLDLSDAYRRLQPDTRYDVRHQLSRRGELIGKVLECSFITAKKESTNAS